MSASRAVKPGSRVQSAGSTIVYVALSADLFIAAIKFAAARHTGSAAMFSEGVHSTVDALTELLLLYGLQASRQPSTAQHPIGFGREVFFWNFIVAMTILTLGAGVALFDGIRQVLIQSRIESPTVSYIVLAVSLVADLGAISVALRGGYAGGRRRRFWSYFRGERDVTRLTVLFSSMSGIFGLIVAAVGTYASATLGRPAFDGFASVAIAIILTVTALFLARSSKVLLIGVPATQDKVRAILAIVADHPAVRAANGAITVHLAPDQILVALSVSFGAERSTSQIEDAVVTLEDLVSKAHPEVVAFLIKPESSARYREVEQLRGW